MIATFKATNFRSLKETQELSFVPSKEKRVDSYCCVDIKEGVRLLKTAIIYGANASGKTNILLAMETLKRLAIFAPQDRLQPVGVEPFLFDKTSSANPTFFELTFYIGGEKYVYELAADQKVIYTESLYFYPKNRPVKLYFRSFDPNSDSTEIEFGSSLGLTDSDQTIIRGNTLNNSTVLATFGKSNVTMSKLNLVYNFFAKTINDVLLPRHDMESYAMNVLQQTPESKSFVLSELQRSDFNICDIEIDSKETSIPIELQRVIQHDSNIPEEAKQEILRRPVMMDRKLLFAHCGDNGVHYLPQESESRGTLRYTGLAAMLYNLHNTESVVMIDEAETSLHYDLLSHFIEGFLTSGDHNSQMIVTTHNLNLMDEDFVRRDTLWFADKNENGETKLFRLSDHRKIHSRVSVLNKYKEGIFGGKPNINKLIEEDN